MAAAINQPISVRKPNQRVQKASQLVRTQLLIFLILALGLTPLILLSSNLNVQQQFCFRIATGLIAASVAALIPGFFEITLGWLRNTIRASGAIGVFLLIYTFNPPAMQQFVSLGELTGDWDYACTVSQGTFPGGETQHGGTANIQIVRTKFGDALSITGNREWTKKNLNSGRVPVESTSIWQTQGCNFTADDRLMYHYVTTEKGADYLGMTTLKIVKDESGNLTLVGSFHRGPGAQNIYGTVFMRKRGATNANSTAPNDNALPTQPSPAPGQ